MTILSFDRWPTTVPSALSVWGNGAVLPIVALVMIGLVVSIITYWRDLVTSPHRISHISIIKQVYLDRKATLALLVGLGGFCLKTWAIWYVRYLELHQIDPKVVLPKAFAPMVFIIGTLMIAVGFGCWLRISLPDMLHNLNILPRRMMRGKPSQLVTWIVLILSVVWAYFMAK